MKSFLVRGVPASIQTDSWWMGGITRRLPLVGIAYFKLAGNILGWAETVWMIFWMAVVATCVLGFLVWRLVLRPVYALTEHAKAVKAGARDAPVPRHYGTPELSELGQAVIELRF